MCRRCADGNEPLIEPSVFFKGEGISKPCTKQPSHYSYCFNGQPLFI